MPGPDVLTLLNDPRERAAVESVWRACAPDARVVHASGTADAVLALAGGGFGLVVIDVATVAVSLARLLQAARRFAPHTAVLLFGDGEQAATGRVHPRHALSVTLERWCFEHGRHRAGD